MRIVLGALCLLAAGAFLSYTYRHDRVGLRLIVGLIALAGLACFAVFVYPASLYMAGMEYERRQARAADVGMDLIHRTNSTMLDGASREFTADLASILGGGHPWRDIDRPRPGDRRGCLRLIVTNDDGRALVMLLQDEYASGDWKFRLLSYRKSPQPVASPNGGPAMPAGDSGASEGRHR
jgi:hypothetical protein